MVKGFYLFHVLSHKCHLSTKRARGRNGGLKDRSSRDGII